MKLLVDLYYKLFVSSTALGDDSQHAEMLRQQQTALAQMNFAALHQPIHWPQKKSIEKTMEDAWEKNR